MRILLLEDNPADAELIEHELRGESLPLFILKRVETEKDFIKELTGNPPDLILSDYDLPCYDGASALREAKARCPDTPFILVTGAISEDRAIETLTQGAKDYVLKGRLSRLVPAIKRVLLEADEHKARRKAEQEVLAASLYARSLIEASLDPMITIDTEGKVIDVNAATEVVTGVPRCQLIGDDFSKCFENPKSALACYEQALSKGSARDYPLRIRHSSGGLTEVLCNAATYLDIEGKIEGVFVAARDCTALRQADEALRKAHADLEEKVKTKRARLEAETRERERIERHLIDRDEKLSIALESAGMRSSASPWNRPDRGSGNWKLKMNVCCGRLRANPFSALVRMPSSAASCFTSFFTPKIGSGSGRA